MSTEDASRADQELTEHATDADVGKTIRVIAGVERDLKDIARMWEKGVDAPTKRDGRSLAQMVGVVKVIATMAHADEVIPKAELHALHDALDTIENYREFRNTLAHSVVSRLNVGLMYLDSDGESHPLTVDDISAAGSAIVYAATVLWDFEDLLLRHLEREARGR